MIIARLGRPPGADGYRNARRAHNACLVVSGLVIIRTERLGFRNQRMILRFD